VTPHALSLLLRHEPYLVEQGPEILPNGIDSRDDLAIPALRRLSLLAAKELRSELTIRDVPVLSAGLWIKRLDAPFRRSAAKVSRLRGHFFPWRIPLVSLAHDCGESTRIGCCGVEGRFAL